jgi:hypothetical protein
VYTGVPLLKTGGELITSMPSGFKAFDLNSFHNDHIFSASGFLILMCNAKPGTVTAKSLITTKKIVNFAG